ncbi:PHB depolymerase family esterase [Nevskia sp.]|uniref:alpha/beta hydrolase family esterase n=1 Tax=Nevskia sp. TaxID=1929292 RepID=UPI0025D149D3|nr:PHB depolymerase family esterase [Nevskia sp.]
MTHRFISRRVHDACTFFAGLLLILTPAITQAIAPRVEATAAALRVQANPPSLAAASAAPQVRPAALGGLLGGLGGALGDIGGALDGALGDLGGALSGTLGEFTGNLTGLLLQVSGEITPTPGTETFSGTLAWDADTRRYVGVRPIGAPAGAPVLLLLHPRGLAPGRMVNLTLAGRLAADYGVWVYVPEANGNSWADDPLAGGDDDVGFLNALMARELSANALDAARVYVAGYSNGGFMAERLACERPALLAGIALVATTLRDTLASRCGGPQRLPVLMFNGTSDLVTFYAGFPTLRGAVATAAFWAEKNQCAENDISTVALPDLVRNDNATVTVTRYNRCVDSTVALYTVNNGGHTWPGTQYASYTLALGETTLDIDATLELWRQLSAYSRPVTAH